MTAHNNGPTIGLPIFLGGEDNWKAQPCCGEASNIMIDKELLAIMACPSCKKPVEERAAGQGENAQAWLVCTGCGLRYPIRDHIPIMLIEEASPAQA